MRYIKYIAWVILDWIFYILQFLFFFPAYWTFLLGWKVPVLHWFFHTNNPYGYGHERYWKHYGKEKWWVAWRWNCLRNSHWNFKTKVWVPAKGKIEKIHFISGKGNPYAPFNFQNRGSMFVTYSIAGHKYFLFSKCIPGKNGKITQYQIGTIPEYRYTLKIRTRKLQ